MTENNKNTQETPTAKALPSSSGSDEWLADMNALVRHLRDERTQLARCDYFGKIGYTLDGQISGIIIAMAARRKFTQNK